MTRKFHIEPSQRRIISKSTLLKFLTYLDREEIETPFLLMDGEQMERKAGIIGKKIRNSRVFYAVKANPDSSVLKFLSRFGLGFEIASEGELKILADFGVSADRIITSNPLKTFKFLGMARDYGVRYMAFDTPAEVEKIKNYCPDAMLYVRLSVPNEGSEWPLSRKFGQEVDEAAELLSYAKDKGLNPVGVTFHVGSQCTNKHNWETALLKARMLWDKAKDKGVKLRMLNIGGGYPISYTRDVVGIEAIEEGVQKLLAERFPESPEIFIEPGRAMVGDAGVFVTKVIGKAQRHEEEWVYIDVGVFNGLMESVGGIRYSYIVESENPGRKRQYTVTGPSCDSFDVIDTNVTLAEPEVGGLMLVLSAGAYTISYASEFNGFSIPKTIII